MSEKIKIRVHGYIWFAIILLIIFIPIIGNACQPALEIIDDNGYIDKYYTSLDETSVDIDITFNRKVSSGYATVRFYDSSNHILETKRIYFYAYGDKTAESSYTTVKGKVDKYEITSYEFEPTNGTAHVYIFLIPAIIMLIGASLLSYKEYDYNGKKISVYAGWFHHTLRVNGEKCDEHNTLVSWTPIHLSTTLEDGTQLDAIITLTNRISLKANDKLLLH
ncbi:MAG: hypothetical protein IJU83_04685 [Clostridia bacterium]|nr:hypothetical protein [Clostridia bacterium]